MEKLSSADIERQHQAKVNAIKNMEGLTGIEKVYEWICIQYDKQHFLRNNTKYFLGFFVGLAGILVYDHLTNSAFIDTIIRVMIVQFVLGWLICLFSPTKRVNRIYEFNEMLVVLNSMALIVAGLICHNYTAVAVGVGFFGFTIAWAMY